MGKINVLMLNRNFSITGGVPRVLLTYARHCDMNRVHLHLASFKPFAPSMADAVKQTGTAIHTIGDRGYLRPALALRKILAKEQIDVVVATSLKAYLVAKIASRAKCRVVYWIHGIALVTENRLKSALFRWAARGDTLIFISEEVRKAHLYPGHRGRAETVPNGVEDFLGASPLYGQNERASLGIPDSALVIGYTGAFIAWKQHRTLIDAFSRLAKDDPHIHLMLIGTGDLFESTKSYAQQAAGSARIHFLGPRADARQVLGMMNIYAHPSDGEGFGLALVEAMLARLAVVVSNAGALPDMIDDGDTGLVFRVRDADDLAAKIDMLARDPELRQRLGEQARQAALSRFGAVRFAAHITAILESEDRT